MRAAFDGANIRVRLVLVGAVLAGLAVWLGLREAGGGSPSTTTTTARAPAVAVSLEGLRTLAGAISTPIYWVGPKAGYTYELTKTTSNQIYLRYLPAGVRVGSSKPYLTIGTYPVRGAFAATSRLASRPGAIKLALPGGVAFYTVREPTSVYLAYPGSDYQVEVYDPNAARAAQLVTAGRVKPVVAAKRTAGATATSPAALRRLETTLGHPIYWAGPERGVTYELTRASAGGIYVRYLPAGVAPGSPTPFLTVATYQVANAYARTAALARKSGAVRVAIGGGGIAFYNASRPTNVYLAWPGVGVQVEVYDPSAARAHRVASRSVTPIR
jgi:hypothetical protein